MYMHTRYLKTVTSHGRRKPLTVEKSDKFDEWQVICQNFPFQSSPC